jgi:rubrerythrin
MPSIWKLAKEMEKEGIAYYEKLSKSAKNPEVTAIFAFLAKEETVHLKTFEKMEKGMKVAARMASGSTAKASKLFGKMAAKSRIADEKESAAKAYKEALAMEKQAVKYYGGMMKKCEEDQCAALSLIIDEEKNHVVLMDALIDFARKPEHWLENAEFNHLDDY